MAAAAAPPYASRRSAVLAPPGYGMVACTQPLAAECGRAILAQGGNATDAAIAVAAGMALTEPCSTGLGGDCFALVYDPATRAVSALNGCGRSPAALSLAAARARAGEGAQALPSLDPLTATVPGAAAGWSDALARWGSGRLSMAQVLAPAARLAREGFPVSPLTAHHWQEGVPQLLKWRAATAAAAAGGGGGAPADEPEVLLVPGGGGARAPRAGELFRNPQLAHSFEELARSHDAGRGAAGFYAGPVGAAIVAAVAAAGGLLAQADLDAHASDFPAPISADFCGVRVHEVPPNGQGIVALMALQAIEAALKAPYEGPEDPLAALNARGAGAGAGAAAAAAAASAPWVAGLDLAGSLPGLLAEDRAALARLAALRHGSPAHLHLVTEALRLAFADARAYVADCGAPGNEGLAALAAALLSPAYAARRAAGICGARAAADVAAGSPLASSDTVSFSVVDAAGRAVSFINSNYMGFGLGLVPRGVGFSLQNRGAGFALAPGHPNAAGPRKRPYHTIIPLLLTARDGSLLAAASCMGGYAQPQGHVQLVLNVLAFRLCAQGAVDAPRLCIADGRAGGEVAVEEGVEAGAGEALRAAGHAVAPGPPVAGYARALFGRAQLVLRDPASGVLWGGSDGRGDGAAVVCRCE